MYIGKHVSRQGLLTMLFTWASLEYGYPAPDWDQVERDRRQIMQALEDRRMHTEYHASLTVGRSRYIDSCWATKEAAQRWLMDQIEWAHKTGLEISGARIHPMHVSDIFDRLKEAQQ